MVTAVQCVSEPFEGNNVARAVHEKIKFDTIKAQFVKVPIPILLPWWCAPLRLSAPRHESFVILMLLVCLHSHSGYCKRRRTWTQSSQSEPSLTRSHPGDRGFPWLDKMTGVSDCEPSLSAKIERDFATCWERSRAASAHHSQTVGAYATLLLKCLSSNSGHSWTVPSVGVDVPETLRTELRIAHIWPRFLKLWQRLLVWCPLWGNKDPQQWA